MKKNELKARRVIGALLQACALLGTAFGAACSDAPANIPCAAYACVNDALLSGIARSSGDITLVDVKLCVDGQCQRGTLDLQTAEASAPCLSWGSRSHVCLTPSRTQGTVAIDSVAELAFDAAPKDVSFQLIVIDRVTGKTLVEETRVAKPEITREDNCHRCWQASGTL